MEIYDYNKWKKRKILIVKMRTQSELIEGSLSSLHIPYIVYDVLHNDNILSKWVKDKDSICGIVISGSVTDDLIPDPVLHPAILDSGLPILGICYGHELLGKELGSEIINCNFPVGEYSSSICDLQPNELFANFTEASSIVTMSHKLMLSVVPPGTTIIASTAITPIAGFYHELKKWWGLQFHPEKDWLGQLIFKNFYKICMK